METGEQTTQEKCGCCTPYTVKLEKSIIIIITATSKRL
jgi:hypothetical protein